MPLEGGGSGPGLGLGLGTGFRENITGIHTAYNTYTAMIDIRTNHDLESNYRSYRGYDVAQ